MDLRCDSLRDESPLAASALVGSMLPLSFSTVTPHPPHDWARLDHTRIVSPSVWLI